MKDAVLAFFGLAMFGGLLLCYALVASTVISQAVRKFRR